MSVDTEYFHTGGRGLNRSGGGRAKHSRSRKEGKGIGPHECSCLMDLYFGPVSTTAEKVGRVAIWTGTLTLVGTAIKPGLGTAVGAGAGLVIGVAIAAACTEK